LLLINRPTAKSKSTTSVLIFPKCFGVQVSFALHVSYFPQVKKEKHSENNSVALPELKEQIDKSQVDPYLRSSAEIKSKNFKPFTDFSGARVNDTENSY
jgi:hypothetical protein